MKTIFKKIHTESFRWYDEILIVLLLAAAHTAWNYTQNVILGLPNSGLVSPVSVFKLDTASAKSSFAYNVEFGLEGSILAITVMTITGLAIIIIYRKKKLLPLNPWTEV